MNSFSLPALFSLAPTLIVFLGSLLLLLVASFASRESSKVWSPTLSFLILLIALVVLPFTPPVTDPLLTGWLRSSIMSSIFTSFFLIVGLLFVPLSTSLFRLHNGPEAEYYFFFLASLFGFLLLAEAADLLTLFIGLETSSIALYVLSGYVKNGKDGGEAALKYFLTGAFATAFLVYGFALFYGATGSTSIGSLRVIPETNGENILLFASMSFITVGLAFKASLVPFHSWAPDVYTGSSTPTTLLIGTASKAAAFAAFLQLLEPSNMTTLWAAGLTLFAWPTLLYANGVALRQTLFRRFFAYSGISHSGFLLLAFTSSSYEIFPPIAFYLTVYSLATITAFAVAASLENSTDGLYLLDLKGLFHHAPFHASLLAFALLTLAGIPPTAGFFAKVYLLKLAFLTNHPFLALFALLTSVLAAFYYLRIISYMLSESVNGPFPSKKSRPSLASASLSSLLLLLLTVTPDSMVSRLHAPQAKEAAPDLT